MTKICSINPIMFRASVETNRVKDDLDKQTNPLAEKNHNVTSQYLDNLALINGPAVQKIGNKQSDIESYSNNLRSMIRNNESVMLAIVPRIFNAKDLNGDDRISVRSGEQVGTFLNAIDRLDELQDDGFNTIHILPIHPTGKKNAMGTAGSLYSPLKFIEDNGDLALDPTLIDTNDPRTPKEQFKTFIDECHKRNIKVMLDLPSCASVELFENEPELMAFGRNGEDKTPQGWADIRMFEPWADITNRKLNPALYEMHRQYVDACIDLGIDGIRADVARETA